MRPRLRSKKRGPIRSLSKIERKPRIGNDVSVKQRSQRPRSLSRIPLSGSVQQIGRLFLCCAYVDAEGCVIATPYHNIEQAIVAVSEHLHRGAREFISSSSICPIVQRRIRRLWLSKYCDRKRDHALAKNGKRNARCKEV